MKNRSLFLLLLLLCFFFAFFLPLSHFQIVILVWAPRSWLHVTVRLSPNAIRSGMTHALDGRMRIRYIFQTLFVSRNYIHNEFDWLKNRGTSRIGGTNMGFANVWVFSVKGVVGPRKKSEGSNITERFALKHFFFCSGWTEQLFCVQVLSPINHDYPRT